MAFTLIEIMVVVAIIGLLAVIAIPSFQKARFNSYVATFMNDLRIATNAFGMYSLEHGQYPPDSYPGIMPLGMDKYLSGMNWRGKVNLGGKWDWDYNSVGIKAGVTIIGNDIDLTALQEVDRHIDDGNLRTGRFRRTNAGGYSWVIEETP